MTSALKERVVIRLADARQLYAELRHADDVRDGMATTNDANHYAKYADDWKSIGPIAVLIALEDQQ